MAVNEAGRASTSDADATAAVKAAVEDYFLGWYDGDPERMRRASSIRSSRSGATSRAATTCRVFGRSRPPR